MNCQQCSSDLLAGAKYCHSCGTQVLPQCRACGTLNPAGSSFCSSCGTSLEVDTESSARTVDTGVSSNPASTVCPRCYENNSAGSIYCYACGLPLEGRGSPAFNRIPAFASGRPAGFWVRFLASIIDGVLLTVVFAVFWPLISGESALDYWQSTDLSGGDHIQHSHQYPLLYRHCCEFGPPLLANDHFGCTCSGLTGPKLELAGALGRYFAYVLSALPLGLGFIMVALRQDKRGLHDLVCDTVVIQR